MPNISLYHACYIELVFDLLILIFTLDTQCTCAFVGLKKGVEKTLNTEVILNLKDAVLQSFGNDVVPKDCFVSSEVRCKHISWARASKLQFSWFWSTARVSNVLFQMCYFKLLGELVW